MVLAMQALRPVIKEILFKVQTDYSALKWMHTCNHLKGRLMRRRLGLSEFDYDVLYILALVDQVRNAISRMLHQSHTPGCEPIDDEVHTFWTKPVFREVDADVHT